MFSFDISLLVFTILWSIIFIYFIFLFYSKKVSIEFILLLSIIIIGGILYTILLISNQLKNQKDIDEDYNRRLLRLEALLPMSS